MIKKRYIVSIIITLLFIIILSLLSFGYILKSWFGESPREALPPGAKIRGDWNNWFPADYCYYLKAEMSHDSFLSYKDKMGFILLPKDKYDMFDFSGLYNHTDPWWIPKNDPNQVYYNPAMNGSQKAFMKYENGFLFYKETAGF
jgi:hypothetical protein